LDFPGVLIYVLSLIIHLQLILSSTDIRYPLVVQDSQPCCWTDCWFL